MIVTCVPSEIAFQTRKACPLCGQEKARSLWQGKFSDLAVPCFMEMFQYSGDWAAVLAKSEIALLRCEACAMK